MTIENACILKEDRCDRNTQKRYETVMCQGNGYLGMRGAFCEKEPDQDRLTLIAGLYDQQPGEVEELSPLPDVTELSLCVNGQKIGPLHQGVRSYERSLNVKNGLMTYSYDHTPIDERALVHVQQRRFVSMAQEHLAVLETVVHAYDSVDIEAVASINARQTVDGTQHFFERERTVLPGHLLWYEGDTVSDKTIFYVGMRVRIFVDGEEKTEIQRYSSARRLISTSAKIHLKAGSKLRILRYGLFYTSQDACCITNRGESIRQIICTEMDRVSGQTFETLFDDSAAAWKDIWDNCDIEVQSVEDTENLKIRLAMYHMIIMCPRHDDRIGIAAKGLTGMGYAGHVFWDCEIFNLPFFTYTDPKVAANVCTYRYRALEGARKKAREYGFQGAMYPWESASQKGEEQSPHFKDYSPDNTPRRVTCGEIEHHVVCDVAYGIYEYARVTDDRALLDRFGLRVLFETADFWQSRLNYNATQERYEIWQVTGPDEYKEYVDNDVFTNYMVHWNLQTALTEANQLRERNVALFEKLDQELGLTRLMTVISEKLPKLYLPRPNSDGLIPQNDTYLGLKRIDITKYKKSNINRLIYRDYSLHEIGQLMVSKQADLIQMFALMPYLFDGQTMQKNYDFYEERCIHDSTLSKSVHALVALRIGNTEQAYSMFRQALDIDFGAESSWCDAGIHAANCGGIWQDVVFGFAGVSVREDMLCLNPVLPDGWDKLTIRLCWRGSRLNIAIREHDITVRMENGVPAMLNICKQEVYLNGIVTVNY